jgi:hypothetical protein
MKVAVVLEVVSEVPSSVNLESVSIHLPFVPTNCFVAVVVVVASLLKHSSLLQLPRTVEQNSLVQEHLVKPKVEISPLVVIVVVH